MSSSTARRTTRRLLKLASLGLAGLIAGLLSVGCSAASPSKSANVQADPRISSNVEFTPSDTSASQDSDLPPSIEAREIPALHHPPSARRLEYGSVRPTAQPVSLNSRTGS
jgi:hypothetical protein